MCEPSQAGQDAHHTSRKLPCKIRPRIEPFIGTTRSGYEKTVTNKGMAFWEEHRMDWRHEAACRDEDPELFFPIGDTGPALVQIEEAKRVCRSCTVVDSCLQWAMDTSQEAGVWGGLSEDERRMLRRRSLRVQSA